MFSKHNEINYNNLFGAIKKKSFQQFELQNKIEALLIVFFFMTYLNTIQIKSNHLFC